MRLFKIAQKVMLISFRKIETEQLSQEGDINQRHYSEKWLTGTIFKYIVL